MNIKDTANHYGFISRLNHWLGALIVIGMLAVGLYFNDMPRGDEKSYWLKLHIGVGGLFFVFLWFRVFWRVFTQSPQAFEQKKTLKRLTQIVHWVLLLSVLIMALSGPFLIWSRGAPINVFDWFSIPSPMGKMPDFHELMEEVHAIVAKVLLVSIIIHTLAVIKHRFIDKDQLLSRMVKFLRK
ncbi:cytochrome b [Marinicella litoralis]|uniref:Cytochrome b561 n=1 Tax=Marinicella litoralis TaxID=644220 RepID=A0A4V3DIN5_9GAMM|nr:cytochrome b [Marinicella litoralis]TDR22751.1 cytochrome b561 [Marinicella litoralis]